MMEKFEALREEMGYRWSLPGILPKVLPAGEEAGTLTRRAPLFWTLPVC